MRWKYVLNSISFIRKIDLNTLMAKLTLFQGFDIFDGQV